jgi:hypothetical protein
MLADRLKEIHTTRDVARLFAELGYEREDYPYDRDASVIARWRGFKVIAAKTRDPRERVRAIARSLAAASTRGIAVVVGGAGAGNGRELCIAAPRLGAPGVSRLLIVPLHQTPPDTLQHLAAFRPKPSASGLAHALRVQELLASEVAGERFFQAFRLTLERMAGHFAGKGTEAERRMITLLQLTRVLFLYFVQAKGWLDNRSDYLRSLLDDCLAARRDFHKTALLPLFFETLNRPHKARRNVKRLGNIPYLNGGLFEPHPLELRLGSIACPNALWRDAFDGLFEKFRFCVREAVEVNAIAPDMLGKVFERVMGTPARQDTGTFYTPETVVRQIVNATIETALSDDRALASLAAGRGAEHTVINRSLWPRARRRLRNLKVLDPAVGSGAFLLGALETLMEMHLSLRVDRSPVARLAIRRRILRENLFGVDLNPIAVRLAELRLWLAVVADDPTTAIARIEPLPNLDGVVRQGDSLLDPISTARVIGAQYHLPTNVTRPVHDARVAVFSARGRAQPRALRRLRSAEQELACTLAQSAIVYTEHALRDLASAARTRDLFGRRSGLGDSQREHYRTLREHRAELKRTLTLVRDGTVPFFSFEVHTPDVVDAGGFSIVLGNPPWVRAERLPAGLRRTLKQRFSWWRSERSTGYAHLPDLSIAFLERALELAAPGAAIGFLVPSKLTSAGYAQAARHRLVREVSVHYLHRVPDRDAAQFQATTYPLALIARKEQPRKDHVLFLDFDGTATLAQCALREPGPWALVPSKARRALEAFRTSGTPLGEVAPASLGVKTGADAVLVGELLTREETTSVVNFGGERIEIESSMLRPVVRGRDISQFDVRSSRFIIWAYDSRGQPRQQVPALCLAHLKHHRRRLEQRADARGGALWTIFRLRAALSPNRVVWADIARHPAACALDVTDTSGALPLNTCYISNAPDAETALVIAAVLNSTWTHALVLSTADEARGGYRRINARVVAAVPIPPAGERRVALARLSADRHKRGSVNDEDLDDAVAEALALPPATRTTLRALARRHR